MAQSISLLNDKKIPVNLILSLVESGINLPQQDESPLPKTKKKNKNGLGHLLKSEMTNG